MPTRTTGCSPTRPRRSFATSSSCTTRSRNGTATSPAATSTSRWPTRSPGARSSCCTRRSRPRRPGTGGTTRCSWASRGCAAWSAARGTPRPSTAAKLRSRLDPEEHPVTVLYYDSTMPDDERRQKLFGGDLFVYSPTAHSLELVAFAREMAETALAPHFPPDAQHHMEKQAYVDVLADLKPTFINHPRSKELVAGILADLGVDTE